MPLAIVHSRAQVGIAAPEVVVETHISRGLPQFSIVGLPEKAVKESRDRVRSAIINSNFEFPNSRISVNLAPADLPKEGGRFDLPIALGVLAASNQIPMSSLTDQVFIGELAFSGQLRNIGGSVVAALSVSSEQKLVVPFDCVEQASLAKNACIVGVHSLSDLTQMLHGQKPLPEYSAPEFVAPKYSQDMCDIIGQSYGKFAIKIAACGGHNTLLMGPPGTGKTMLASRLPSILPPMTDEEALQTLAIKSVYTNEIDLHNWRSRPFRSPHHSASSTSLVGGGSIPKPGEISLAHNGVLFLDELTEFDQRTLDLLREPLESNKIHLARASMRLTYQCDFLFVAACNPCRCGYYGDIARECECTPDQIRRYQSKLSGPLLDRIDIQITIPRIPTIELRNKKNNQESSEVVRQHVQTTRQLQQQRQQKLNSQLSSEEVDYYCRLSKQEYTLLDNAIDKFNLSNRVYYRILKLARTIADVEQQSKISKPHLYTAIKMHCNKQKL